ncbi:class I SAM-dependent methyltransferase [Novispirillum sp. DQ9]|uniref:class I SAM-dependent methyltransferase n=1 Tax=Novispirillum sp. DQ9 TaxID=3398612 RepID=UPI003C7BC208
MSQTDLALSVPVPSTPAPRAALASLGGQGPWTRLLLSMLLRLRAGTLDLTLPDGRCLRLQGVAPGPRADLTLRRDRAARRMLLGGGVGFGESHGDGDWDSGDIAALVRLLLANEAVVRGASWLARPLGFADRLVHLSRANTRRGSRRNIAAHYDLGNAFYSLWLDPGMTYSSALFASPDQTLEAGQAAKYARVAELAGLRPGQTVLEIGCGWGGMLETAADLGCQATGLTLSTEQKAWAERRLGGRAEVRLQDYRDVTGRFDRIVSIEMIEAVGEAHWPTYFRTLADRLAPGGVAVLQAITIAEDRYPAYRRRADFIQRHVFPGGMLPTPSIIAGQAAAAGLRLSHQETFGPSYARTLDLWADRFRAAWPEIAPLGFDERFRRLWEMYLGYCSGGFSAGTIDVGFYRLDKVG